MKPAPLMEPAPSDKSHPAHVGGVRIETLSGHNERLETVKSPRPRGRGAD